MPDAQSMVIKGKWVAFSAWLSTFWQQSRAISETGWLPSLPQFCSNEGAVLPKQTGSLEMYLNYLLNPGSLSYLPTNGPVVRHSTLQCHSSVKPPEWWAGTIASRRESERWQHALWWRRSGLLAQLGPSDVYLCVTMLNPHRMTGLRFILVDTFYYSQPLGVEVLVIEGFWIILLWHLSEIFLFKYFEAFCSVTL